MDFIHQSVASDTPNDKQKSETGCFYEDPYPGRLRRLLYTEQIIRNNVYFEDQHPDNQLHQNDLMVINVCISYEGTINLSLSLIGLHASVLQDFDQYIVLVTF